MKDKLVLTLNTNIISRVERNSEGKIVFYDPDDNVYEIPKNENRESEFYKKVKKLARIL